MMIDECLVVEFAVTGDDCPLADASRAVETTIDCQPPQLRRDGNALLRFSVPAGVGTGDDGGTGVGAVDDVGGAGDGGDGAGDGSGGVGDGSGGVGDGSGGAGDGVDGAGDRDEGAGDGGRGTEASAVEDVSVAGDGGGEVGDGGGGPGHGGGAGRGGTPAGDLATFLDADERLRYLHASRTDDRETFRCLSKHPCVVHELTDVGFLVDSLEYRDGVERYAGAVVGHDVLQGVLAAAGETVGVSLQRVHPLGDGDDRPVATRWDLTPAQTEALREATEMGYFSVPREAPAAEVAAELGISKSAFLERLRRGQRGLLEQLFA